MWFYGIIFFASVIVAIVSGILLKDAAIRIEITKVARTAFIIATTIAIVTLIVCATLALTSNSIAEQLIEENYQLNLYYGPVNNSFNEYVRYDFYADTEAHNSALHQFKNYSENFFLKPFFQESKLYGIQPINFSLRVEDFYG